MQRLAILILLCFAVLQPSDEALCDTLEEKLPPDIVVVPAPSADQMAADKSTIPEQSQSIETDTPSIPGAAIYACHIGYDEAKRLAKDGVYIGSRSMRNYIDFEGGNILLNPETDIVVGTRLGNIDVKSGAIAFIMHAGKDLVIYDLCQTKPKQISILVTKRRIYIEPGRMLVLTGQDVKDFENLEACHHIAYCNVQFFDLNAQHEIMKGFIADFSVSAAIIAIGPLRQLSVSKNREDKAIVEKILKGHGHFAIAPVNIL